jgi:hypothetical protein
VKLDAFLTVVALPALVCTKGSGGPHLRLRLEHYDISTVVYQPTKMSVKDLRRATSGCSEFHTFEHLKALGLTPSWMINPGSNMSVQGVQRKDLSKVRC